MSEKLYERHGRKVIVVSGGANNIGKGIALSFLKDGWQVGIMDRDKKSLDDFPERENVNIFLYTGDVSDEYAVAEFYVLLKERFGRLDAIVNNAAYRAIQEFLGSQCWRMEKGNRCEFNRMFFDDKIWYPTYVGKSWKRCDSKHFIYEGIDVRTRQ